MERVCLLIWVCRELETGAMPRLIGLAHHFTTAVPDVSAAVLQLRQAFFEPRHREAYSDV